MRRLIIVIVGVRIDAKLSLHVFSRLVRLPLDYFERHPAGETMYNITQINQVREFITGKLLTTFLDLITLCVLLPFLFYLNATLAWIVVVCACIITLIIVAYLRPLRVVFKRVVEAETKKHSALAETIYGIKTVKALALEPQRKALWDERGGRRRQVAHRLRQAGQLAADPGDPDRAVHVDGRHYGRRLSRDDRHPRLHGRQPVRLHDAVAARRAAAGRTGPADRGLRGESARRSARPPRC